MSNKKEGKTISMNIKRTLIITASGAFLLFALLFWYANQNFNNAQLALNYYEEPDLGDIQKINEAEIFQVVRDAFYRKNYARVVEIAPNIPPMMDEYADAQILYGHALMKTNQPKKAIELFTDIVNSNESKWKNNAAWHRILANVQAGNELQTIHFLDEIIEANSSDYVPLAKELKNDVTGFWRKVVLK